MGLCCPRGKPARDAAYEKLSDVVKFEEGPDGIVLNGNTVGGVGAVLANAPIMQTKAYFEVRIRHLGTFGIGIGTSNVDQAKTLGEDEFGWGLVSDASVRHGGEVTHQFEDLEFKEGAIVGISFDQSDLPVLNYFYNGKNLGCLVISVKGNVYPCVSVADGAELECNFGGAIDFAFPMGFDGVLCERTLI